MVITKKEVEAKIEGLMDVADHNFTAEVAIEIRKKLETNSASNTKGTTPQSILTGFWGDVVYENTNIGEFFGKYSLTKIAPDKYKFSNDVNDKFYYQWANKKIITPGKMDTDMGSIPVLLRLTKSFQPDTFLPAYLIHDWLFTHNRLNPRQEDFTFMESAEILKECIKTLMIKGGPFYYDGIGDKNRIVEKAEDALLLIYLAVGTPIALALWNS